ncbi:ABC-type nickel/cobalt efflux system permease component RcnA [Roseiarcus fermentans]|uniref:Nickel/cobalt efflux system n=1 Tax=Roseiarcus fermentans TaxID=1473586 RepID=A0A366FRK0_9HYPH|nr:high frequency lysogenization protein HflD [Roseiarcus fermentans]RBP17304.1 ABC-type nickel/cobalt efflux system permease component RcnA [Roseiarcus fermentans]
MTKALTTLARALAALLLAPAAAAAQIAHRPFAVGGGEGGGGAEGGVTGFVIAAQSRLTHLMAEQVHALHSDPSAFWGLAALGLGYGVFHAAGPGHGKALIASYMMANESALRRGVVMAFLAALLQAIVAILLVGAAALIVHATASQMNAAADWLSVASSAGVAAIGLWLCWRKGGALVAALRERFERREALAAAPVFAGIAWEARPRALSAAAPYRAAEPGAAADLCCAPDAAAISGPLTWREAAGTVIAAGSRPCSGAILMLVFALAQGVFPAGIAATFAMALGVAVTTASLAAMASAAKAVAMRFASGEDSRAALVARAFEFAASLAVLAFGLLLLIGARGGA